MESPEISLFTDGACSGNPGTGGYGLILCWNGKGYKKELSGGFINTTNNRMELMAVVEGLKKIKLPKKTVQVISDSKYVVDAVAKGWVFNWEKKKFKNRKNPDLWIEFLKYYRLHRVNFQWVRGHNGHPENERCDYLATNAIKGNHLKPDIGFKHNNI